MSWVCSLGLRTKAQLSHLTAPRSMSDRWGHGITHILTFGTIYLSNFCHLEDYKVASHCCYNFHLFDYWWVWAFVCVFVAYQDFPFCELSWDIFGPFFHWLSLSFCVGLKGLFVYPRNYFPDCFKHWQYLPWVCCLLHFYLRFLVHARGRNTLTKPQK